MEKVVFIVGEKFYSKELLSRCLERYTDAICYCFFHRNEMLMYLDLKPELIIGSVDDLEFENQELLALKDRLVSNPMFYLLNEKQIAVLSYKDGKLKRTKRFNYNNLYSSLTALVNHSHKQIKSLMML